MSRLIAPISHIITPTISIFTPLTWVFDVPSSQECDAASSASCEVCVGLGHMESATNRGHFLGSYMRDCQNYGPFCIPIIIRHLILRVPKKGQSPILVFILRCLFEDSTIFARYKEGLAEA